MPPTATATRDERVLDGPDTTLDADFDADFDLDVTLIESGPTAQQLLSITDNGCNSTCGTACNSCRS